ncbi:MAG: patatin-like phospholipase family protein [Solirubrobacteraceae bacterium]|nr:patatin-like phospholipase family protein [Solirubrobacteraceae bacterium]
MSTAYPYSQLVFEGGGVKGVAYVGALEVLDDNGVLGQVDAVAGTSAGAITAALVALGQTPAQLRATMLDLDFSKFEDGGLEGPVRLVEHFGWYRGDAFKRWLEDIVATHLGSPGATFKQLAATGAPDLRIVTTDISSQLPKVFSATSTPDVAIADAVRMSMSIPLFFAAVRAAGSTYVDGGVVWNYPIGIFDTAHPDPRTLGLRLETAGPPPPPVDVDDLVVFVKLLYESLTAVQADVYKRTQADVERTIAIDDLGIVATDFAITREQKLALIDNGAAAAQAYLAQHAPPAWHPSSQHPFTTNERQDPWPPVHSRS